MADVWIRVGLVLGALVTAAGVAVYQRSKARGPVRDVVAAGLEPGLHFFSSAACPTCRDARNRLTADLGESGFTEHAWEESPGLFSELAIGAVPAFVVVGREGRARVYPGRLDDAIEALGRG